MDEKKLNSFIQNIDKGFWSFWDNLIYTVLERSVDMMPPRLQKLIANYYTDARIRKMYFDRLGVKMGDGTFANLGMKIIVSDNYRYSIEIGANVSIGPNLTLITEAAAGNGK